MVRKQAYNDTERQRDISLLFSGMEECMPHHVFFGRRDHFILHYITKGEGTVFLSGKTFHLKMGDAFFIFPLQRNRYQASEYNPWTYRWIAFTGKAALEILHQFGIDERNQIIQRQFSLEIDERFNETYRILRDRETGFQAKSVSNLIEIIWDLTRFRRKRPVVASRKIDYVETAKYFISINYMSSINVSGIADYLGIHRSHLARLFKQKESMTLQEYLGSYRIQKAQDLLVHNDDSIAEIAASVGYDNYFTFEKRFREITGWTPTKYRHAFRLFDPKYVYE